MQSVCIAGLSAALRLGCSKEQTAIIPTYIHIDSFHFKGDPSIKLDSLTNINAVWVYYNSNPIGVFDLPATFPVLGSGAGTLTVLPVIAVNGLNNQEAVYPFYKNDSFSFEAAPGRVINHMPITSWYPATTVYTIDSFNVLHTGFTKWGSNVGMIVNTADSLRYNGAMTGGIFLNAVTDSCIDSTSRAFPIAPGSTSFIEFDYTSNIPFELSMQANLASLASTAPSFVAGVMPADHWKKFYLYVSDFAARTGGTDYNLFIKATLPINRSKGRVLLANIKLLSIK